MVWIAVHGRAVLLTARTPAELARQIDAHRRGTGGVLAGDRARFGLRRLPAGVSADGVRRPGTSRQRP